MLTFLVVTKIIIRSETRTNLILATHLIPLLQRFTKQLLNYKLMFTYGGIKYMILISVCHCIVATNALVQQFHADVKIIYLMPPYVNSSL